MNSSSKVTFNKTAISFNKGGLRYGFGNTGVAKWIQAPFYPRCPISGEEMKFLVSFDMDENKEQIEISKFYERLPNPAIIATNEFFDEELHYHFKNKGDKK